MLQFSDVLVPVDFKASTSLVEGCQVFALSPCPPGALVDQRVQLEF